MINSIVFSTTTTMNTFSLKTNALKTGINRIFLFYTMVLFPLLAICILLYNVFEISNNGMMTATFITLAGLISVFLFYIKSQTKQKSLTLQFNKNEIKVSKGVQVIHCIKLKDLKYEKINWGIEEGKRLAAIQIQGTNLPKMTIGGTVIEKNWDDVKKCIDCTDFIITSEKEWKAFVQLLKV